ncbi:hypothetical protein Pyn_38270 [Prunus yedoensis var. nudiflora]|uniref:Uncharacterized protein n=1 Tax=Prunus yedoensis var. nudiflora TaxID=2094558 RepID=A0A314ZR48_PRUYE|nr:hypothetical protein Pyn_38270 [Prunus yedoensis var. nudiflora]
MLLQQHLEEVVVELAERSRGTIIISFYNGLAAIFPSGYLPCPKRYENFGHENLMVARSLSSAVSSNALLELARVREGVTKNTMEPLDGDGGAGALASEAAKLKKRERTAQQLLSSSSLLC